MNIILSCPKDFQEIARQQFADAELELDSRKAVMVNAPRVMLESWDSDDWEYFRSSTRKAQAEFQVGDLVYLDCEPDGYTMHRGEDPEMVAMYAALMHEVRAAFPKGTRIGIYGLIYNRHWPPYTTASAGEGAAKTFTVCDPDFICPCAYANYNASISPLTLHKTQGDFASRIHLTNVISRSIAPGKPIHPFYQPVLHGSRATAGQPLSKRTVIDWVTAQFCSGTTAFIWWYEPGAEGELVERNGELIKQQAPWIKQAIGMNTPGNE